MKTANELDSHVAILSDFLAEIGRHVYTPETLLSDVILVLRRMVVRSPAHSAFDDDLQRQPMNALSQWPAKLNRTEGCPGAG